MTDSEKMDLLLEIVTAMGQDIKSINQRLDSIEKRLDELEKRQDSVEKRLDSVEKRLDSVEKRLDSVEKKLDELEEDSRVMKMILENEIRVNIQRVAEGHLDLSRILHEAMRPSNEAEMLAVRVSMLESDVKELKRKVG